MDDPNLIREQMEQTRGDLTEKLEILENRVAATVQEATQEVAQTVQAVSGSVQETVEAVTETVHETVDTVKETVEDTLTAVKGGIGAIKDMFDVPAHVERYPWIAVGGSVAGGFFVGEYFYREKAPIRKPAFTAAATTLPDGIAKTNGQHPRWTESLLDKIAPELKQLGGLALGALMAMVRETVSSAADENLKGRLEEIIDNITKKIGGTPLPSRPSERDVSSQKTHGYESGVNAYVESFRAS